MKKQEKGVKGPPASTAPASCATTTTTSSAKSTNPTTSGNSKADGSSSSSSTTTTTTAPTTNHGGGSHSVAGSDGSCGHQSGLLSVCHPVPPSHKPPAKVQGTGTSVPPSSVISSSSSNGSMGMKHSKSDHTGLGRKEKDKHHHRKEGKAPMGKKFISKSQENLSSQKKGKHQQLSTVSDSPRPRANAASTARAEAAASERNKENLALKEREKNANAVFVKPKPVKQSGGSGLRKASSTQSIDKTSQGSNGVKSSSSSSSKSSTSLNIKRTQSTQNISKDKFMKKRTSAPADVMAYNAELLANFEKEKKVLETRISELTKVAESRKGEIEKYKYEVRRLKDQVSASASAGKEEMDVLRNENRQLSDRLRELGFPAEQTTDTEKLMLKFSLSAGGGNKSQGESNSDINLPASASCDSLSTDGVLLGLGMGKGSGGSSSLPPMASSLPSGGDHASHRVSAADGGPDDDLLRRSNSLSASEPGGFSLLPDLCATPDHPSVLSLDATTSWEKQSNKSANSDGGLSEVSVACLTERILQMEETNYSTTEELQATLQELGDLQDAVNELTEENGRLADEKTVLLESLCAQTEKLENTRIQLEQLKCLLISGELPDKSERDGHLLGLLKSAQEEREELMRKQTEWSNAMQGLESECQEAQEAGESLRERYSLLEESVRRLRAERDVVERQVAELKEAREAERTEASRLRALLEGERDKVSELESRRAATDPSALEALLDCTRREKARAEGRVAELSESLARSQGETARLKEAVSAREQELVLAASSASHKVQELQFQLESGAKEKIEALEEVDNLRNHLEQLEQDCNKHLEDKKGLTGKVHEAQGELRQLRQQKLVLETELQEMSCRHDTESEEWRQFQKDLQTAVVIANNFSQETQEGMDQLSQDNSQLQEQVTALQSEMEKLRADLKVAKEALAEERRHLSQQTTPHRKPSSILTNAELKGKVGKVLNTMDSRDLVVLRGEGRSPLDQRSQSISVKSLIRSIEEQVKSGCSSIHSSRSESRRSSTSSEVSLNSLKELVKSPTSPLPTPDSPRSPSKDFTIRGTASSGGLRASSCKPGERSPQQRLTAAGVVCPSTTSSPLLGVGPGSGVVSSTDMPMKTFATSRSDMVGDLGKVNHPISSILKDRNTPRRNSGALDIDIAKKDTPSKDPLACLAKQMKGSKRNALLKWCQIKTIPYSNVDITNFSSSWNDGLGFCALLHSYVPEKIPYSELAAEDKRRNFSLAFKVGEGAGIKSTLNINDMVCMERPDWQAVMTYVTAIYKHFEMDKQ